MYHSFNFTTKNKCHLVLLINTFCTYGSFVDQQKIGFVTIDNTMFIAYTLCLVYVSSSSSSNYLPSCFDVHYSAIGKTPLQIDTRRQTPRDKSERT